MPDMEKKGMRLGAELLIVLQSVIYGFGDPISKIAFDAVPVYSMMTVRYTIAFAMSFLLFRKRIVRTVKSVPLKTWLVPGVCIGLSYVLNNIALSLTEATSVAFLRSMSVIFTPALALMITGVKYRARQIAAQVLVLPGVYLLCVKGGLSGFGAGEVIALLAAAATAAALVFSHRYLEEVDPLSMTALQGGCSALIALAGCISTEGGINMSAADTKVWAIVIYLAVMCTFIGYLLQNVALISASERAVSLIQCLCPVMTAVFSLMLLGEKLSVAGIAGAAIIIICSVIELLNKRENDQK